MNASKTIASSPVARAIKPAWKCVQDLLLSKPFRPRNWFWLGVIIFMDFLGHGLGTQLLLNGQRQSLDQLTQLLRMSTDNPITSILLGVIVLPIALSFVLFIIWVGSRGQVMFVRAVQERNLRVSELWLRSAPYSNYLFRFTVGFNGAFFVLSLAIFLLLFAQSLTLSDGGRLVFWSMLQTMYPIYMLGAPLGLIFWLVNTFLRDMVLPLMLKNDMTCMEAWARFTDLVREAPLTIGIYLVARVVLAGFTMVVGIAFFCVGLIPVVAQIALAPLLVFDRALSIQVLEFMLEDSANRKKAVKLKSGIRMPKPV